MSIMVESVYAAAMDLWMKNVVSWAYYCKGMPPGRLADWNPVLATGEHTCDMHTAKVSTARLKREGGKGQGQPCWMPRRG